MNIVARWMGVAVLSLGFMAAGVPSMAAAQGARVELFGVAVKQADRTTLRKALQDAGVSPKRLDDRYWVDLYDAGGVLEEASELALGYVFATKRFAYAQYTFPSFMDTQQVKRVIDMVSHKYGRPRSVRGDIALGNVSAIWVVDGIEIEVRRGWPSTTTYLEFREPRALAAMRAEIQAQEEAKKAEKARTQSRAF